VYFDNHIGPLRDPDGKVVGIVGVATDITERKRAEEALRESEAQLKGILKAAPIGIALVQGRVALWVNDYFSTMTGYSAQELVGKNPRKLYTSYEEFLRTGELKTRDIESHGKSEVETRFVCKNGKTIDVLLAYTPLDPEDPSAGIIVTVMDITERKKAEEQERETKYLRELDKLRTELLANVSHNLRTPLASVKGFATLLIDYDKKLTSAEKREYLEIIDHNTDRLSELIEQLLVMSRLGAGILTIDRSPSDMKTLCREVISEAKIRSPEFSFVLNAPKRLPRVFIDSKRIRQVLDNLIDNAVKHSFPGTEISVTTHRSNDEVVVKVTDKGTGISRQDKPYVFDRMFHTRRKHKMGATGAGLGLSICKGLIEAHQGRIWIESEEGRGTRCFFTLPTYNNRGVRHGKKDKEQYHSVRRG
jgi:PAS domain S-box-containing protein